MKCKKMRKRQPAKKELAPTAAQLCRWRKTSERLTTAVELIEEYPAQYPPELLPALIF